jgi:photosystem II stability/assembly factor-like uncharacterized protein
MRRENIFFRCILLGLNIFCISIVQTKAQNIDTIYTTDEVFAIEVLKGTPGNILLAGTYSYVSKSTDYGKTWINASFDTLVGSSDISFNNENNNIGFLATGAALSKSIDGGLHWFYTNLLDFTYFVDINPYFPNIVFVWGSEDGPLGPFHFYRSFDGGTTWQDSIDYLYVFEPQFHPDSINIAYAHSGTKVLKTTDTGKTWSTILGTGYDGLLIEALWLDPKNPNVVFAGGDSKLYKTSNGGLDWQNLSSGLITIDPAFIISSILGDENIQERLYVGWRTYGTSKTGLFLTENDGKNWVQIYDQAINIIEADKENPRNIYCATNFGVIKLVDTFSVTGINEIRNLAPEEYLLLQNYPNPFNPSTKITYQIGKESLVQLKVYDVLGREVTTLVNTFQSPGIYKVEFEGEGLSSGVYFYRIFAGNFVDIKKMILAK